MKGLLDVEKEEDLSYGAVNTCYLEVAVPSGLGQGWPSHCVQAAGEWQPYRTGIKGHSTIVLRCPLYPHCSSLVSQAGIVLAESQSSYKHRLVPNCTDERNTELILCHIVFIGMFLLSSNIIAFQNLNCSPLDASFFHSQNHLEFLILLQKGMLRTECWWWKIKGWRMLQKICQYFLLETFICSKLLAPLVETTRPQKPMEYLLRVFLPETDNLLIKEDLKEKQRRVSWVDKVLTCGNSSFSFSRPSHTAHHMRLKAGLIDKDAVSAEVHVSTIQVCNPLLPSAQDLL